MVRHFVVRPNNAVVSSMSTTTRSQQLLSYCFAIVLLPAILLPHNMPRSGIIDYSYLLWTETADDLNGAFLAFRVIVVSLPILLMVRRFLFGSSNRISSSPLLASANNNNTSQPALILSVFSAGVQLCRTTTAVTTAAAAASTLLAEDGGGSSARSAPQQQHQQPSSLSPSLSSSSLPPLYFLPRSEIVDCVVQEVIWSYKVTNVLFFRVVVVVNVATTRRTANENKINNNNNNNRAAVARQQQQQTTLRLVEVFPGVELLYMECLMLRAEILQALGIRGGQ
jgi:hypothetical protein